MRTKVNILFWVRRKRGQQDVDLHHGVHIMCRIGVGGQRKFDTNFHTGLDTVKSNWRASGTHGHVTGKTAADKHINTQLTKLLDELTDIHADLERQHKPVTARTIYNLYRRGGSVVSMLELYEQFLAERKTLIGIEISESSYKVSQWRQQVLKNFLEAKKLTDLRPEEFTHNMGDKFVHWGLTERNYHRNNINKALQNVVQCLRWGARRELLATNPMELYKYKAAAKAEMKYLTAGELQRLTACVPPTSALERTRDSFIFQCWTGLAYADLAALDLSKSAHYHRDSNTNTLRRVLHITRAKSTLQQKYECVIPLLPEAERILAKYDDSLPVVCNPLYNRRLKELGQLCGLGADKMSSHVGRKTAGTLMLNLGIRMETVSKFLGHSSVRMTEKLYAKILDTTVVDDFNKLFGGGGPLPAPPLGERELPALELTYQLAPVAAEPAPDLENNPWRRPPPVACHDAPSPGGRVVPLWAEAVERKEVAACG